MTRNRIMTLDDGRQVDVGFTITSWGSGPSWEHPGDPVEIEIESWELVDGSDDDFKPSDEEADRIEQEICEQLDQDGPDAMDDDV